ncbi:hypothetical protein COCMIDRAFT_1849 [Bipolaris oryzae ATCC 44560]|uniref:BTB domain-containing protein n=1 Tax=Bipolaris oryzae ATCC 44560 TaxID=930090 RepID=W6ZPH1_COCMI|nr:uncharacterized protein COCMIDRAFT_1849 [Bipolaris oryzae ATCC 44560]EUC49389.1 hypothetical protein COCMIDRAFT_1849 [Bipolaris oryzae ATCC 44560]
MFPTITKALGIDTSKTYMQIQNTITNMDQMPDGHDIRSYSSSSREELLSAGAVNIFNGHGENSIATVPKLALVVVSSTFRKYLTADPDAEFIKITEESLDENAVAKLMEWVNTIISISNGRLQIELTHASKDDEAIATIHMRHAAQYLGMEKYVEHLVTQYKSHIHVRIPTLKEGEIIERFARQGQDDMLEALAARLEYLRRTGRSNAGMFEYGKFLKENPKVTKAIKENRRIAYSKYCFSCRWNEKNSLCGLW